MFSFTNFSPIIISISYFFLVSHFIFPELYTTLKKLNMWRTASKGTTPVN